MTEYLTWEQLEADGGWLAIDKELGVSSAHVVNRIKHLFHKKFKVGHGGTLDPLATGVLPIALGKATRTVPYVMDGRKTYRFTIAFGESRSTDDMEGEVRQTTDHIPTKDDVLACLPEFIGDIMQCPPAFSALKVNGKRAYDLARAGSIERLPARPARVDALKVIEWPDKTHATLEVSCGKGVYVRSLARDIAEKCDSLGYVSELRRISCGPFDEKDALTLEKFTESISLLDKMEKSSEKATSQSPVLSLSSALADILALDVTEREGRSLVYGQTVQAAGQQDGVRKIIFQKRLLGLAQIKDGTVHPYKMFTIPSDF